MRVLYDPQIFVHQKYGGVSRYFYELLHAFREDGEVEARLSLLFSNNRYIRDCGFAPHCNLLPGTEFRGKGSLMMLANKFNTARELACGNYDLFHPTYYDPYFLKYLGKRPFVLTVYDMIHEKFQEMFVRHNPDLQIRTVRTKELLAHKAARIIAISRSTKQDLVDMLGIPEGKISVVHLANSLTPLPGEGSLPAGLPGRYLLFVGGRSLHKNFDTFLKAAASVLKKDRELAVVCAGGGAFTGAERALFEGLAVAPQLHHCDADDASLGLLYRNALCFVFPSLYEGFGIPILEAFGCQCPLLCSDSSSFPEVAGDAALYFDPLSVASIADALTRALSDGSLLSGLKEKGRLRLAEFSLAKTASETKRVYREIV